MKFIGCFLSLTIVALGSVARAQTIGKSGPDDLVLAQDGKAVASIVVSPAVWAQINTDTRAKKAPKSDYETRAALDLQAFFEKMSGARPEITAQVPTPQTPAIFIGAAALEADKTLQSALEKAAKPNPTLRADAIVLKHAGNRVFVAGNNDESDYFAVSQLLQMWGCRWYFPGDFGEYVPHFSSLKVGVLDFAYGPPFEIRRATNRSVAGQAEWNMRNFGPSTNGSPAMGALNSVVAPLVEAGKTPYDVAFSDPKTAEWVAEKVSPSYERGGSISLGGFIEEYKSEFPREVELRANVFSKYTGMMSSTDAMMEFYNRVGQILREKYPQSHAHLNGISYSALALPPQRATKPDPALLMWLVAVDYDPMHSFDDPRSTSRQEWGAMMRQWASVMEGRVAIYDYDEPMLVWRDAPAPTIRTWGRDMKQFRDAKILGFNPEMRGSLAVNGLNSWFRAQLMWNPDADSEALLTEFFAKFYGPAAAPMGDYWHTMLDAWDNTLATEHEFPVFPAVYTPDVVETMRGALERAEKSVGDDKMAAERVKMARLGFDIVDAYAAMIRAGATDGDFGRGAEAGKRALEAQLALAKWNPSWTSAAKPVGPPSSLGGETAQFGNFAALQDGTKGTLVAKTPLLWNFHRDPNDTGLARGWAASPVDLKFWNEHGPSFSPDTRKDYPITEWEQVRSDLYLQAQGIRHPDGQGFTGFGWYRTSAELPDVPKLHLMFPGLFNECWLYVNGKMVAHRPFPRLWWRSDYRFEWDVDLSGHTKPGKNEIALRISIPQNFGGMFRRPFFYRATE